MVGCLSFLLILLCQLTLTRRSERQLTWSTTCTTKSASQEQKESPWKKQILAMIYCQIQKTLNAADKDLRMFSKKILINWSQSHRRLSPFIPLVPLELEIFETGQVGKKRKSPLIHWAKLREITSKMRKNTGASDIHSEGPKTNWKNFGRAGLNGLMLRLVKKRSQ